MFRHAGEEWREVQSGDDNTQRMCSNCLPSVSTLNCGGGDRRRGARGGAGRETDRDRRRPRSYLPNSNLLVTLPPWTTSPPLTQRHWITAALLYFSNKHREIKRRNNKPRTERMVCVCLVAFPMLIVSYTDGMGREGKPKIST